MKKNSPALAISPRDFFILFILSPTALHHRLSAFQLYLIIPPSTLAVERPFSPLGGQLPASFGKSLYYSSYYSVILHFVYLQPAKSAPAGHFSFVVGSTTRAVMPCPHKNGGKQFSQSTPHTPLGCGGALLFRVNSPQASTNRCELPQNILQLVILCLNSTICI